MALHILVVDDDADVLTVLVEMLRASGLKRVFVALGRAAACTVRIRQTAQPLTAGARHGFPDLFDLARQRLAWFMGDVVKRALAALAATCLPADVAAGLFDGFNALQIMAHGLSRLLRVGAHGLSACFARTDRRALRQVDLRLLSNCG
jgi:CheY-like chemotaxis protein